MDKRVITKTPALDETYTTRLAEEFKKSKEALALIEKRTNELKKELSEIVDTHGAQDENGSLWVRIGDMSLKRERRIQRSLDVDAVEQWAKENGHWDEIKRVIEVVDEDKLVGLAWNNEEIADQVESMYVVKEIWAFKA